MIQNQSAIQYYFGNKKMYLKFFNIKICEIYSMRYIFNAIIN